MSFERLCVGESIITSLEEALRLRDSTCLLYSSFMKAFSSAIELLLPETRITEALRELLFGGEDERTPEINRLEAILINVRTAVSNRFLTGEGECFAKCFQICFIGVSVVDIWHLTRVT